jgi:UPF0271 protein
MQIDLNCDMGESFGRYKLGEDEAVIRFITSANIACGQHAGDPLVMRTTVQLAKQHGVAVGAHPGWPDLQGFGRREMAFSQEEAEALLLHQIGALAAVAKAEGINLRHVKPHGALYNQAVKDRALAAAIARAVSAFDKDLVLVGLAGSLLIDAGRELGLRVANEGFPDRRYRPNGTLVPRVQADATIEDAAQVAAHAVQIAVEGIAVGGRRIKVETLCLHGDHPHAVENARLVREALEKNGFRLEAF